MGAEAGRGTCRPGSTVGVPFETRLLRLGFEHADAAAAGSRRTGHSRLVLCARALRSAFRACHVRRTTHGPRRPQLPRVDAVEPGRVARVLARARPLTPRACPSCLSHARANFRVGPQRSAGTIADMGDEVPAPKSAGSKLPSGVDRSKLLESLKLSPRERFERAVKGGRDIYQFCHAYLDQHVH